MGLRLAADFDLELFLSEFEKRQTKRDEALRAYLTRPRVVPRSLFVAAPAPSTSRLVLDLGAPAGGMQWSVQQVNVIATDPFTSAAAAGAAAVAASSGVVAAAVAAATLPAVAGQTNSVSGFQITGLGATGATVVVATLTGVLGGTQSYEVTVPAGATTAITPVIVSFNPPLPATGPNVAITISVPSFGAGNTNAEANIQGTLSGSAGVAAALFSGAISPGAATGSPLDMGSLVAGGLTPPVNYQAGGKSVLARDKQHLYAVLAGNLAGFSQYFASAVVVEVPDTMEALAWL